MIIPTFLLLILGSVKDANLAKKLSDVVGSLPKDLQAKVHGQKGPASASYALAVYLFAPLAIIVPLTVSSAVGAHTIVGERERGSGEFLAHSPATERQIYLGKLMASLIPGYFTAAMGFLLYSLVVNLIVGPKLGGWFFPTTNWWVLMLWVLPPFIALALAVILAISARVSSAAAAQQASALATLPLIVIAYGVSSNTLFRGVGAAFVIGGLAWCGAIFALWRASKAVSRERLLGMGALTCAPRYSRQRDGHVESPPCTRASRRCGSGWPTPSPTRPRSCRASRRVTYREFDDRAARLAAALADLGVGPDTKVALFLHNCPEYMECLFALSKLRAVPRQRELPVPRRRARAARRQRRRRGARVPPRRSRERVPTRATACPAPPRSSRSTTTDARLRSTRSCVARARTGARASNARATTSCSGTPAAPPACPRACSGTRARCSGTG